MTWWNLSAGLLGGVGLFLLGMRLMTEGLKLAAGPAMSGILARSTKTRFRALLSGMLVTSLVQSSSAVIVSAIGFVNAGLLTLQQTLWVLFGANVGTTVTGWLVVVMGLQFKIETVALPLIGVGMVLRITAEHGRRGAVGLAMAGFGVLFVAIGLLRDSFSGLAAGLVLPQGGGALTLALQVLVGVLMTVLMQSSSAAMAVTLTAAQGGLIGLEGAAAIVIGANIGTSVKAMLAGIGATPNAKRAAAGHVFFNLVTGAVALTVLPWLVPGIAAAWEAMGLGSSPAPQLALFHTLFNVLGVLLMWPIASRLTRVLQKRFRPKPDDAAEPQFLDPNTLAVPALALDALHQEVRRSGTITLNLLAQMLRKGQHPSPPALQALEHLNDTIADFVTRLHHSSMSMETASRLPAILRVVRYYDTVIELMAEAAAAEAEVGAGSDADAARTLAEDDRLFREAAASLLELVTPDRVPLDDRTVTTALETMMQAYQTLKAAYLGAGAGGDIDLHAMDARLRYFSALRRACEQSVKAERLLRETDAGSPPQQPPAVRE